ncbi:FtsQ-type POTRA domain-containing protein [bacterium]|nr:FtsQ-type POTRA domain-containing protein [bacterium]
MLLKRNPVLKDVNRKQKTLNEQYRPKRIRKRHFQLKRYIFIILSCLSLPSFVVLLYLGYTFTSSSDFFNLKEIAVLGNQVLNRNEVIEDATLLYGTNIFTIDPDTIRAMIKDSPYIKQVNVRRELPSTIVLELFERKPIAVIADQAESYLISEDGMLLEELTDNPTIQYPVVLAPLEEKLSIGTLLNDSGFMQALTILSIMKESTPECYSRLVSIQVRHSWDISLRLRDLNGEIIISSDQTVSALKHLSSLLPKITETDFEYIDLRFSQKAVVKFIS